MTSDTSELSGRHTDGGTRHVLVAGLPLRDSSYQIAAGVEIRALPRRMSVFDLAAVGAAGFQAWGALEQFASSCVSEIVSSPDGVSSDGYDTLHRAWLVGALLTLRGFSSHVSLAVSSYSWATVAGHVDTSGKRVVTDLDPFHGSLLDYHIHGIRENEPRLDEFQADDAIWLRERFPVVERLAHEAKAFRFALEASTDWRFASEPRSAIARIWSGIEALLSIEQELSFRAAATAAALLETRGPKRRERFASIRELYNGRSRAVHGDEMSTDLLEGTIEGSLQLLRELILHTSETGRSLTREDFLTALFE